MPNTASLFELNEHLRRVVALNFPQAIWISAELSQVAESKGHFYLDLVQKDGADGGIIAQAQAMIWAREFRQLLSKLGLVLHSILREGLELKLLVRPEFHERYGLKLHIQDIDPAFTLGQVDLQRKKTIQSLRDLGLFDKNRQLPKPRVMQRIALVSSAGAAGKQDFIRQLEENSLGYRFSLHFFDAAVQGVHAEKEIIGALKRISKSAHQFDVAVIVRGGGSKLDLGAFDNLELCKVVTEMPIPVLAGIGHDVDETVLDLVANVSLKTPTAVAEYLVQHNLLFEGEVLECLETLQYFTQNLLLKHRQMLEQLVAEGKWAVHQRHQTAGIYLGMLEQQIPALAKQLLRNQRNAVLQAESYCAALHPEKVLSRGFSLTFKNKQVLMSAAQVAPGERLETRLSDGTIFSEAE
jgi:exodeoxyribonuclease VII large subunit